MSIGSVRDCFSTQADLLSQHVSALLEVLQLLHEPAVLAIRHVRLCMQPYVTPCLSGGLSVQLCIRLRHYRMAAVTARQGPTRAVVLKATRLALQLWALGQRVFTAAHVSGGALTAALQSG